MMTKTLIAVVLSASLLSCKSRERFDKVKWAAMSDMTFPNRASMVEDLIENHPLKGKSYHDIISLLGRPQCADSDTMDIGYLVEESYGTDIDPIYTQTLWLHFQHDSTVRSFELREWKKR